MHISNPCTLPTDSSTWMDIGYAVFVVSNRIHYLKLYDNDNIHVIDEADSASSYKPLTFLGIHCIIVFMLVLMECMMSTSLKGEISTNYY